MIQLQINLPSDIDFLILKYLDENRPQLFLEYKRKKNIQIYSTKYPNNIINKNFECLKIKKKYI